jgi:hypothetical protein
MWEDQPKPPDDHFAFVEEIEENIIESVDVDEFEDLLEAESEGGGMPQSTTQTDDQRRSGKRRRRRRRGGRRTHREGESRPAESEEPVLESSEDDAFDLEAGEQPDLDDASREVGLASAQEQVAGDERSPDERRLRRRRRRGGRRRGVRGEESRATGDHADDIANADELLSGEEPLESRGDAAEPFSAHEHHRRPRHTAQDDREDSGDSDSHEEKAAPSIPTWKEVIGLIIAGNMEARARSPKTSGGGFRGRGGRGQGNRGDGGQRG